MKIIDRSIFFAALLCLDAHAQVRSVMPTPDAITDIHCAVGIATIVQIPEAIQSAIIGDQAAFRVESLDRAVTIKPLNPSARTNLYLLSERGRYNLRLSTASQSKADYVVYVKRTPLPRIEWRPLKFEVTGKTTVLALERVSESRRGTFLLDGQIRSTLETVISPEQFWIMQGTRFIVIDHLLLAAIRMKPGQPLRFTLAVSRTDVAEHESIRIEFRNPEKLAITLPKGALR